MKKDYTGWEVVDNTGPDYSGWEIVDETGQPGSPVPPQEDRYANSPTWIQALNRFNQAPLTQGFRTGIERTAQGLLQPLYESGLLGEGMKQSLRDLAREREERYAQASEQAPFTAGAGNILGAISSSLPTAIVGGGVASGALPYVGRIGAGALGAATEGGLFGASQYVNEDESRIQNAINDALLSGGLHGALGIAGKGLKSAANKFYPSAEYIAENYAKNIPAEELIAAERAARGTYTPIGDVLRSGELKKQFENKIAPGIGSNVSEKLGALEKQIGEKTTDLFDRIGGKNVGADTNRLTKKLIEDAYSKQNKLKNELYKDVSKISSEEGFNLDLNKFLNVARDSKDLLAESLLAKADPQFKKILTKMNALEAGALSTTDISIKDAQILANKLNNQARSHLNSPLPGDRYTSGLYNKLSNAIKEDIKDEVSSRGSDKLKNALNTANENYKKNYAGFLDKDIYKYTLEGKDAESIVRDIIRPSKAHDKALRIKKVQQLLPEEEKNILGYTLLQGAADKEGKLDPRKINSILNSLGSRQFKALFPDEGLRNELKDFQKLLSMNSEALNRMYNPKTGGRLQSDASSIKNIGKSALAGSLAGTPAAIATLGGTALRNKLLSDRFTSEAFREAVVEKALKGSKASKDIKSPGNIYKALIASLGTPEKSDKGEK